MVEEPTISISFYCPNITRNSKGDSATFKLMSPPAAYAYNDTSNIIHMFFLQCAMFFCRRTHTEIPQEPHPVVG
jgi:hypothetical protein